MMKQIETWQTILGPFGGEDAEAEREEAVQNPQRSETELLKIIEESELRRKEELDTALKLIERLHAHYLTCKTNKLGKNPSLVRKEYLKKQKGEETNVYRKYSSMYLKSNLLLQYRNPLISHYDFLNLLKEGFDDSFLKVYPDIKVSDQSYSLKVAPLTADRFFGQSRSHQFPD